MRVCLEAVELLRSKPIEHEAYHRDTEPSFGGRDGGLELFTVSAVAPQPKTLSTIHLQYSYQNSWIVVPKRHKKECHETGGSAILEA
jgi:hypothetical protein